MNLGNEKQLNNNLLVSIDWMAFTSTVMQEAGEMIEFLGYSTSDFQLLPKGAHGYRKMYRLNSFPVTILSDGSEDMGVHAVITGSAIQDVLSHFRRSLMGTTPFSGDENIVEYSHFDNDIMLEFLQQIRRIGWLTRFDLAVDDLGAEFFSLDDVCGFLKRQEVVSKFRKYKVVNESTLAGEATGYTVYLGSRQSEVMLRVYDKQLEQNQKAESEDVMHPEAWVRWELELKNERANIAADLLVSGKDLGLIVMEILNNYVRIVELDDSNRSRCSVHPLWEKFTEAVGKLSLFVKEQEKTLKEKRRWIVRSVLPTLAGIIVADGGSFDIITQHFDDAVLRMSNHMQQLVTESNPDWWNDYFARNYA